MVISLNYEVSATHWQLDEGSMFVSDLKYLFIWDSLQGSDFTN